MSFLLNLTELFECNFKSGLLTTLHHLNYHLNCFSCQFLHDPSLVTIIFTVLWVTGMSSFWWCKKEWLLLWLEIPTDQTLCLMPQVWTLVSPTEMWALWERMKTSMELDLALLHFPKQKLCCCLSSSSLRRLKHGHHLLPKQQHFTGERFCLSKSPLQEPAWLLRDSCFFIFDFEMKSEKYLLRLFKKQ